ncbi:MAG: hypothetical protein HY903_19655 [Deltaproteobacteria bacterium]|nr:hypothetical protein [Deltaproteobacteria bacterium]
MIQATNGVFMPAMSQAKKASASGNQISGPEAKAIVKTMTKALKAEYDGADSSKGLARDRDVLARTAKAIVRNAKKGKWGINANAVAAFKEAFGPEMNGKAGTVGALVEKIRDQARANSSSYTYHG